jgi:hypothetical protein
MQVERELFARSRNGVDVLYDPINSHASTHFADTPQIVPIVRTIIESTILTGDPQEFETDTGDTVGNSDLVETDATDLIVYAIRKNRDHYARFTKSRGPQPSSKITVRLEPLEDTNYELYSAWIGPTTPPFPGTDYEAPESRPFWNKHALAWGTQEIQPGTETTICPW